MKWAETYMKMSPETFIKCLRRQLLMSPPIPYMGGDISYMSPVTRTSNHLWTAVTHV